MLSAKRRIYGCIAQFESLLSIAVKNAFLKLDGKKKCAIFLFGLNNRMKKCFTKQ